MIENMLGDKNSCISIPKTDKTTQKYMSFFFSSYMKMPVLYYPFVQIYGKLFQMFLANLAWIFMCNS